MYQIILNSRRVTFFLLAIFLLPALSTATETRLINGTPVTDGSFNEVVRISSNGSGCTATVVGPRVIATAAHCGTTGATATFSVAGIPYSARLTRSNLYPSQDHDISLGITSKDINGVTPASMGGNATKGLGITLLGYGCTNPGGGGGNDGTLRKGNTIITRFSGHDMVSKKAGGAALCFGDSGGPAFVIKNGKHLLLGINSKGNIQDTNYNTRTDISQSEKFFQDFIQTNSVKLCGVNDDCDGGIEPDPPTCTMQASPNNIELGQGLTISIQISGNVTSARIDGTPVNFPTGSKTFTPNTAGNQTSHGSVEGPGGTGACSVNYLVNGNSGPTAPTCTLTATPNEVALGDSIELELKTLGKVESAHINGTSVNFPVGKIMITPTVKGTHAAFGNVTGPGGMGSCRTGYAVDEELIPEVPFLTVVPTHCGYNALGETEVWRVCLALLKKSPSSVNMALGDVLLVTYRDQTREVLPIIHRKNMKHTQQITRSSSETREQLTVYANNTIKEGEHILLDSRTIYLWSTLNLAKSQVPTKIEGRSGSGQYFVVEELKQQ